MNVSVLLAVPMCLSLCAPFAHADESLWGQVIFHDDFVDAHTCPAQATLPDGSTRSLKSTGTIKYGPLFNPPFRDNADLGEYAEVWGYGSATDPLPKDWPGETMKISVDPMGRDEYLCVHARVTHGHVTHLSPAEPGGPNILFAVSNVAGSFDGRDAPTPGCTATSDYGALAGSGYPAADKPLPKSTTNPALPRPTVDCILASGSDVYYMLAFADPTQSVYACPASRPNCKLATLTYGVSTVEQ